MLEKMLCLDGTGHLDELGDDERAEIAVVGVEDTGLGRAVLRLCGEATRSYRLVNLFPAATVAVACMWVVLGEEEMIVEGGREEWVRRMGGGRVEVVDFEEAVVEVGGLRKDR